MIVEVLETRFTVLIDRQLDDSVDTVENKMQIVILSTIKNLFSRWIELSVTSKSAYSGQYAASFTLVSDKGEYLGTTALCFQNVFERSKISYESIANDETRENILSN